MDTDKAAFVVPFLHCPDCLHGKHRMVYLEECATWKYGPSSMGGAQYVHTCPECSYDHEYSEAK